MSESLAVYESKAVSHPTDHYTVATNVAHVCKAIVTATAQNIQGRKYVRVEGWQAIATAHGCVASARDVENVDGGLRCIGEVRRMDTGAVIATAEGFVGDDEKTWASRPVYARRAMCQTRGISRACRSAFAHVVVMMNAGLETTPAEEVPVEGFIDHSRPEPANVTPAQAKPAPTSTPAPARALPKALDALNDGETAQLEKTFDKVAPPPEGKKAHRVWFVGDDRDYPTMHNFSDAQHGDKMLVTFKASAFNGKLYYWVDSHANLQADELPLVDAPAAVPAEPQPLPLPKGLKEIWPESEFPDSTEVIFATVANVIDPVVSPKTGKAGPYKVSIRRDDESQFVVDTFDTNLAALCQAYGAAGEPREIAYSTTVNGKWTNRKLEGVR